MFSLDNMGRPDHLGPVSLWKYPDPDVALAVMLVVIRARPLLTYIPTFRDNHWMITWDIGVTPDGHTVHRRLHIVQEPDCDHLTNWGPITSVAGQETERNGIVVNITTMTLAQRQALESIANTTPVFKPNGEWNCQNWILAVLEEGVKQGLLTHEEYMEVVVAAQAVAPWSA